jgi:NAD(P)-dependent dehydrogenase (short-subunit alcohol dehydrogenase family)
MVMEFDLKDKVAIVTGGSRGIGKGIAQRFLEAGASVMIVSRKADVLEAVKDHFAQEFGEERVASFAGNAGDEAVPAQVVSETLRRYSKVDILVNNAGTNPHYGSILDITSSQIGKILDVNVRALVLWTQEVWLRHWSLHSDLGGSVINLASIGGLSVDRSIAMYNVSKAAVIHLTKQLAPELGPQVRVNTISPGLIKTDMARALWEGREDEIAQHFPLRRLGRPSDVAELAVFLASDLSSWVTGSNFVVDGGALVS